jgi:hypothetical protein
VADQANAGGTIRRREVGIRYTKGQEANQVVPSKRLQIGMFVLHEHTDRALMEVDDGNFSRKGE